MLLHFQVLELKADVCMYLPLVLIEVVCGLFVVQLFVVLVPIVGFVAFLWFADREIISSTVSF